MPRRPERAAFGIVKTLLQLATHARWSACSRPSGTSVPSPRRVPAWRLEQIDDGLWRALALSARRSESGPLLGRDHRVVAHWLHLARLRSDRLPLRKRIVPRRAGHLRGLVGVRLIQGFALKQHLGK